MISISALRRRRSAPAKSERRMGSLIAAKGRRSQQLSGRCSIALRAVVQSAVLVFAVSDA